MTYGNSLPCYSVVNEAFAADDDAVWRVRVERETKTKGAMDKGGRVGADVKRSRTELAYGV